MNSSRSSLFNDVDKACSSAIISVILISDSRLMCEAFGLFLRATSDIKLLGAYGCSDVIHSSALASTSGQMILIDSGIGIDNTIDIIHKVYSVEVVPLIVLIEMEDDSDVIIRCIEAGASGYVLKGASIDETNQIVRGVSQGLVQCSPLITARLFSRLANLRKSQSLKTRNPLTPREIEVLELVAKGHRDREISNQLFIEICTVKHHVHKILHKLNVKKRREAATLALEQDWIILQ